MGEILAKYGPFRKDESFILGETAETTETTETAETAETAATTNLRDFGVWPKKDQ
jgi:hypothetical protein